MRTEILFGLLVMLTPAYACSAPGTGVRTPAQANPPRPPLGEDDRSLTGYDGGVFLRSEDGKSQLVIEGLFQTVASVLDDDRDPGSDVALKRMRPELSGRVADSMRFKLEPNFTEHDVELEEAWIGFEIANGNALAMLGRMKAPFNLEEVRSRRHIDFPRFSIINQLAPAEDHGVFVNGRSPSGRWELGLAAYNGTGASDTNSSKDVAGRVMFHPFAADGGGALRNLQLGLAGTIGSQEQGVGGESIDNALGLPVITFAPGVALDGYRWRAGLEVAWFDGPWFVQGEAIAMSQEMSLGTATEDVYLRGAYLSLSRVLTGEDKTFDGVSPDAPFESGPGSGSGAWVIAARLSQLEIADVVESAGLAAPGAFTNRIRTLSVGLNWILNDHAILRNALVYSSYDDEVLLGTGSDDSELGLLIELQLHF